MRILPSLRFSSARRSFRRDERGVAGMELGLCIPVLLTLFIGGIEMSNYLILHQKTEKLAMTVSDLVAQLNTIDCTNANITQIVTAAEQIMQPYQVGASGVIFVSSVNKAGTANPVVLWQRTGGGTLPGQASKLGAQGANAALPAGFTLADKDNVIVAEVYYSYTPIFMSGILSPQIMYKSAYFKPRLGALTTIPG